MQTSLTGVKMDATGSLEQTSQSLEFAATTTVTINISVVGQNGSPINLSGSALLFTVKSNTFRNAVTVVAIQATIDNAAGGLAHFTIPNTAFALSKGAYVYDVTLVDSSGNSDQVVPIGSLYVTASSYTPGQQITPLASQLPLALGPQGPIGPAGPQGPIGPAGSLIVATMNDLRALAVPTNPNENVFLAGYHSLSDGGEGWFNWSATSTAADDGGLTIKPTAETGAGRWLRVYNKGVYLPQYFGAPASGVSTPLSMYFSTLGAAQAIYPHATSLNNEYDWVAIQAAVNAAMNDNISGTLFSANGGTVFFPKGLYLCDQTINCSVSRGLTLFGVSHGGTSTGNTLENAATLIYTGNTVTRFVDGRSSGTLTIDGLGIGYYSATWNGRIIDISHVNPSDTQNFTLRNCSLGGMAPYVDITIDGVGAHSCLYCSNAISSRVENCVFVSSQRGIYGRAQDGSYFNAFTIDGCTFVYIRYALVNFGELVRVNDCIFEGSGGQMRAMYLEEYTDVFLGPAVTFTFDVPTQTITRSSGSWITDGFVVGQVPVVFGFTNELNIGGLGAITALTDTVMTVASGITHNEVRTTDCTIYSTSVVQDKLSPTSNASVANQPVASQAAGTITRNDGGSWIKDGVFVGEELNVVGANINNGTLGPVVAVTDTQIYFGPLSLVFSHANSTITRADGHSFVNDGWQVGMVLNIQGTVSNNGTNLGTVTSVTANVLTFSLTVPFTDETSATANVYALFEEEFSAHTRASTSTTLTDGTMTSGHLFQSAGCGPVGFSGCWCGDQFLPSVWLQFGGADAVNIHNCEFVGNRRVSEVRQQTSGFKVGGATHVVTVQEPFHFIGLAGGVDIRTAFASDSADIAVADDTFINVDMFNTTPTATNQAADVFSNGYKKWSINVRDGAVITKNSIGDQFGSIPLALQVVQGGNTVMAMGGVTFNSAPTGLLQAVGPLIIQGVNSGPVLIGRSFNKVGIGYGYYDTDLVNGTPTSWLHMGGAIALPYRAMTTSGSIDEKDGRIGIDCTNGSVTGTLPDATTCKGRCYTIKKIDSTANVANIATVNSQTIEFAASPHALTSQGSTVVIFSTGSNWLIDSKI